MTVRTPAAPASGDAAGTLLTLHRAGTLAEHYPRVGPLLSALDASELARAGRLLARLDPDEVRRAHPAVPAVTVCITGHGELSPLVPALTAELARHGVLLRPVVTGFDSYVFELTDPGSTLHASDADLALCVLDPAVVFDEVPTPWRVGDVERVAAAKLDLVRQLVARYADAGRGTLVLNTMPLPRDRSGQLVDHRSRALLGAVWREANAGLLRLVERYPALVVVDLEPLVCEGIPAVDPRLDVYAGVHLSPDLLARYAREVGHLARQVVGRTRKCLAVDLDGTVWGGVLGEDGVEGIEVADSLRGEAFRAFQAVVKQLGSQGVLVAAVSKNDPDAVRRVFTDHPRMTLRDRDLVRVIADWRPKHDTITELAADLNIGVDSVVFVDDSRFERGLVRHELPGVAVVDPGGDPALHVRALLRDGWFDVGEVTTEDRNRPARYREDLVRRDFLHHFTSVQDYLRELGVAVVLARVTDPEAARISQITLRTNQFNMTTRRLQPHEVRALAADPAGLALGIHASDRFGEDGLVGAVFIRRHRDTVHIDNFLLSCRVFSRGIEQTCLAAVLRHARTTGATAVVGEYRPTAKNGKVRDFYPRNGFVPQDDDGTGVTFRHSLAEILPPPDHVHLTERLEGGCW